MQSGDVRIMADEPISEPTISDIGSEKLITEPIPVTSSISIVEVEPVESASATGHVGLDLTSIMTETRQPSRAERRTARRSMTSEHKDWAFLGMSVATGMMIAVVGILVGVMIALQEVR